jgi:hypothetical protein
MQKKLNQKLSDEQFKEYVKNYNFTRLIQGKYKNHIVKGQRCLRYNICPCCGGTKWHFLVFPETNTYSSFTQCCRGGDAYSFLINIVGMSDKEAFKEICNINNSGSIPKLVVSDEAKKDLKRLNTFFVKMVDKYKEGIKLYLSQKDVIFKNRTKITLDFYEKYIDVFILSDFYKDYDKLIYIIENFNSLFDTEVRKEILRVEKHIYY